MIRIQLTFLFFLTVIILFSCNEESGDIGSSSPDSYASLSDGSSISSVLPPGPGNGDSTQLPQPGVITAGEWNDLDNWDFWYQLIEKDTFGYISDYWMFYPLHNRYSLEVRDNSGAPVTDVQVALMSGSNALWRARTDNMGRAECWADPYVNANSQRYANLKLFVEGNEINQSVIPYDQGINVIIYPNNQRSNTLDIVFTVDATGSMGDELEYLKSEVLDVIESVKSGNPLLSVKMGAVFYRDEGDEYITKVSQISSNIQNTVSFIKDQHAAGGGDYPEAVHTALKDAVEQLNWSDHAIARIMFMLLDAPPHYESQIISSIQDDTKLAAEKGIKIIPVSASGIDKGTEFLLRYLSILTNGTYVFITNDSGIGNNHITPTVGDYDVEYLNQLMVRLINKYVE